MTQGEPTQDADLPESETRVTPQPPAGEDIKKLVTPGKDAADQADADPKPHHPAGDTDTPGFTADRSGDDPEPARPEDPDEAQSPT